MKLMNTDKVTEPNKMALTNQEIQAAFRKRNAAAGKKELRGIWVTDEEEKLLKKNIREFLKIHD